MESWDGARPLLAIVKLRIVGWVGVVSQNMQATDLSGHHG